MVRRLNGSRPPVNKVDGRRLRYMPPARRARLALYLERGEIAGVNRALAARLLKVPPAYVSAAEAETEARRRLAMTFNCAFEGCQAHTRQPFTNGWTSMNYWGPGVPAGFYCPRHVEALEALAANGELEALNRVAAE